MLHLASLRSQKATLFLGSIVPKFDRASLNPHARPLPELNLANACLLRGTSGIMDEQTTLGRYGMRSRRLRFILVGLALTVLWLCVRFYDQAGNIAEKILGSPKRVDPLTLHLKGEFMESNLGTAVDANGAVTVRLIAQQFIFVPHCVVVPVNSPVRFRITSADVAHRFAILDTGTTIEVVPGHVSESQVEFSKVGEYAAPCREFCGPGHYSMRSHIAVVAPDRFSKLKPEERLNCDNL